MPATAMPNPLTLLPWILLGVLMGLSMFKGSKFALIGEVVAAHVSTYFFLAIFLRVGLSDRAADGCNLSHSTRVLLRDFVTRC